MLTWCLLWKHLLKQKQGGTTAGNKNVHLCPGYCQHACQRAAMIIVNIDESVKYI